MMLALSPPPSCWRGGRCDGQSWSSYLGSEMEAEFPTIEMTLYWKSLLTPANIHLVEATVLLGLIVTVA